MRVFSPELESFLAWLSEEETFGGAAVPGLLIANLIPESEKKRRIAVYFFIRILLPFHLLRHGDHPM